MSSSSPTMANNRAKRIAVATTRLPAAACKRSNRASLSVVAETGGCATEAEADAHAGASPGAEPHAETGGTEAGSCSDEKLRSPSVPI